MSESTYPDFNGKHGHVKGEYEYSYLSKDEACSFILSVHVDGFSRCYDILSDGLNSDVMSEISKDIENVNLFFKNSTLSLNIDLIDFENNIVEKDKILNLLKINGYKVSEVK